jgi:uncharacterized protein (DUF305 family)
MKTPRTFLAIAGLSVGLLACGSTMPMAGYDSTTPTTSRQAEVAAKGATVMPFDLVKSLHTFTNTSTGGVMMVATRAADDAANVALIRTHLTQEAAKFAAGNFDDPSGIHGADMPGLAALKAGSTKVTVVYAEAPQGAQLTFTTAEPALVAALHSWFDAQVMDHGTDAMAGHSPMTTAPASGAAAATPAMAGMGGMGAMTVTSEFDFLTQMIPHHTEAVETATIIVQRSTRPEMVTLAKGIIEAQNRELTDMRAWLNAWYPGKAIAVAYTPMMKPLAGLSGDALDQQFLTDMVGHHGMAVMMAMQVLNGNLASHPEVTTLAKNIRDSQRAENMKMAGWLQDWFKIDVMSTMMDSMHGGGMMNGMHPATTVKP